MCGAATNCLVTVFSCCPITSFKLTFYPCENYSYIGSNNFSMYLVTGMFLLIDLVMYYLCSFNVYFIYQSVCLSASESQWE